MTTSEEALESKINELVDNLENDKKTADIKLMNDSLFVIDINTEFDTDFNFGEPKEREEDQITYI